MEKLKRGIFSLGAAAILVLLSVLSTTQAAAAQQTRAVTVRVVDENGAPVPGLWVDIRPVDGDSVGITGEGPIPRQTDENGEYRDAAYPVGRALWVELSDYYARPAHRESKAAFTVTPGTGAQKVTLLWNGQKPEESLDKIQKKAVLCFVNAQGRPVSGLFLMGGRDNPPRVEGGKPVTGMDGQLGPNGPDGRYVMTDPAADSYTVSVGYPQDAQENAPEQSFSFVYPGGSQEYTFILDSAPPSRGEYASPDAHPTREIEIRVVDPSGKPVPDVAVSASPVGKAGSAQENTYVPESGMKPPAPAALKAKKANENGIYTNTAPVYASYQVTVQNNLLSTPYKQTYRLFVEPFQGKLVRTVVFDGPRPRDTLAGITEKVLLRLYRTENGEKTPAAGLRVEIREDGRAAVVSDGWTDYAGVYLLLHYKPARYTLRVTDEKTGRSVEYALDACRTGGLELELKWPFVSPDAASAAENG